MTAATEENLPPVMPQGNLVEVLGREVGQRSPGELMVGSSSSRQRRPPCKTNKGMSGEAADAAAVTYLLTCPPQEPPLPTLDSANSPLAPEGDALLWAAQCHGPENVALSYMLQSHAHFLTFLAQISTSSALTPHP